MSGTVSAAHRGATAKAAAGPLLALVLAAVAVRILTSVWLPSVVYPDETFQLIEQADRVVTGRGLVPWEFEVGARSWLLPGILIPLVGAGRALSADPRVALGFVTAAMIALSAACVWSAYVLGRKAGEPLHGLFAAGLVALWPELVYFSPHVLADTVSGGLLLCGLAVCAEPCGHDRAWGRLFWGGLLLGAAFAVRIQLAPAIGLAGLMTCGRRPARYIAAGTGFVLPVAALGIVDWLTWGAPFQSVLTYLKVNSSGVAEVFGHEALPYYLRFEAMTWRLAAPLVVLTAVLGARRAPVAGVCAAAILATFSLVGHKEPRFIYPALPIIFALCGVGSVEVVNWARTRLSDARLRRAVPIVMIAAWAAAGTAAAAGPVMRPMWQRDAGVLHALDAVNADPASCGLALAPARWDRAGLSRLRRDLQLYEAASPPAAYNRLLAFGGPLPAGRTPPGFILQACYGPDGGCLYGRPGACATGTPPLTADPPAEVRRILDSLGPPSRGKRGASALEITRPST